MIKVKKFYITTPIYYINDSPSVGTAYTTVLADVIARWHRLTGGEDVFFLTGLDENSSKTLHAAEKKGVKDIQGYTNEMASKFIESWKNLNISYDDFIRTTEERHKKVVYEFFEKVNEKGDIYKGEYKGLYCEGCEAFLTSSDLVEGKCPYHKKPPKEISEENYFFRLSKYSKQLLEHIESNPEFVQPETRRNEVVRFIKDGLKDISISRPNLKWGIKLPVDEKQTIWVWFDALINYISGAPDYFPANLHLVGKDIIRFHCVIWPAMLISAGYKLPDKVFAHGFFTVNGQKMSKSLGNVINPDHLVESYGSDALRYYLIREIPFGDDGDFSERTLVERINNELANDLGNLVSRVVSMLHKYFDGKVPDGKVDPALENELDLEVISKKIENLKLHEWFTEVWNFIIACNKYVNDKEPWKLTAESQELKDVIFNLCESLRVISILISPVLVETSAKINNQLGIRREQANKLNLDSCKFGTALTGKKIEKGKILFKKIE